LQNRKIAIKNEDGLILTTLEASFSSEDLLTLNQYLESMSRLRETALVQRGIPMISNMHWSVTSAMRFICGEYSNPELFELLHVSRHLILEREPASFHKILTLLRQKFENEIYISHQEYIKQMFADGELSMFMQISIGEQKLLDNSLLQIWLNGTQYHADVKKNASWKKLELALTTENARAIVITQLHSKIKALALLEYDVKLITSAQSPAP
jgi:hypothetical protein